MSLAKKLLAEFPETMVVPEPFQLYFRWLEQHNCYGNFDNEGFTHILTDPSQADSCMYITPPEVDFAQLWTNSQDPAVYNRLAICFRTGGDGSYAGLWQDDDGEIQIVHLGSGSGSVMLGIMTNNAVDFLRLLAIGYDELCWRDNFDLTPEEVYLRDNEDEDDDEDEDGKNIATSPPLPQLLRSWIESTFNVQTPRCAADIINPNIPDMGDDDTDDAFYHWLNKVRGE